MNRILFLALSLVVLTLPASRAQAAGFPDDYFGTHGDASPSVLGSLAANGVGVERSDANWSTAEPVAPVGGNHTYQWSVLDNLVRRLAQSGVRYYPLLHHAPEWARVRSGDLGSAPSDIASYARFVAAFAARYGEQGAFWTGNPSLPYRPVRQYEIWNEPNSPNFWNPTPRPSEYFSLYRAAQDAVHAVQPGALVVTAGLVDSRWRDGIAWLRDLERAVPGALRAVDAVGFHPYLHNAAGIVERVRGLRQMLAENGAAAVPIEITEFGAPAAEVSLSQWGSELTATVRNLATSTCGITRIIAYRDQDPTTGTGVVDRYAYYVMYDRGGTETGLGAAYFTGIAEASRTALSPYTGRICPATAAQLPERRTDDGSPLRILSYRIRRQAASARRVRVSYRLSRSAGVTFTLKKWRRGGSIGRRWAKLAKAFTLPGGTSTTRFLLGRVVKRRLSPGRYHLIARAGDAPDTRSRSIVRSFRIRKSHAPSGRARAR